MPDTPTMTPSRVPIAERIRDDILREIRENALSPGAKLTPVRAVADSYGVALRTAAQAYEMLRDEGHIVTRRGVGSFVAALDAAEVDAEILLCIHPDRLAKDDWLAFERLRGMMNAAQECNARLVPLVSGAAFSPQGLDPARLGVLLFDHNFRIDGFSAAAEYALEHGLPMCVADTFDGTIPGVDHDRAKGFEEATAHLLALGHRRIAALNCPIRSASRPLRFSTGWQVRQGYWAAFERAGLVPDRALYIEAESPESLGPAPTKQALEHLLAHDPPPTAIVCNNDVRAMVALNLLKARGVRVPEDLSIIGRDNRPETIRCSPPLTTVDTQLAKVGQAAVHYLADRLAGHNAPTPHLPPRLVVRHSTAAPQPRAGGPGRRQKKGGVMDKEPL